MTRNQASKGLKRSFVNTLHLRARALALSRPQFPLLWGLDDSVGNVLAMQNLSSRHRIYVLNKKAWGCMLLLPAVGKWRLVDSLRLTGQPA